MLQRGAFWLIIGVLLLTACSPQSELKFSDLPAGDAAHGGELFKQVNGAPACITCHSLDDTVGTGPSMVGVATRAETRETGVSATDYLFESITRPAAYVVSGFPNTMYTQYKRLLTQQDIADLIAYLLTLK